MPTANDQNQAIYGEALSLTKEAYLAAAGLTEVPKGFDPTIIITIIIPLTFSVHVPQWQPITIAINVTQHLPFQVAKPVAVSQPQQQSIAVTIIVTIAVAVNLPLGVAIPIAIPQP